MLIEILVLVLIIGIIYWLVTALPIPEPLRTIAIVILAIVAIIYLLRMIGVAL